MNNNEKLLNAIGEANTEFIPDIQNEQAEKPKNQIKRLAIIGTACAACIAALAIIGSGILKDSSNDTITDDVLTSDNGIIEIPDYSSLEILSPEISFGDMGFEGMMAYDISELDASSPYDKNKKPEFMPVYKNLSYTESISGSGMALYLSEEELAAIAQNTADALDVEIKNINIELASDYFTNDLGEYADMISAYEAECNGEKYSVQQIDIRVFGNGDICIDFEGGYKLPEGYSFSYGSTSDDEAQRTLEYFKTEFSQLIGYENPVAYSYGDRTYSGNKIRQYYVYDKSENYTLDILNYSFSNVEFYPYDGNGRLMCIWIKNAQTACEGVGKYPIITETVAEKMLCEGKYISSVPKDYLNDEKIAQEDIKKVDLIYLTNNKQQYYMPYYKFYVELSDEMLISDSELKTYGIYYVPAVFEEFLTDFTLWNGEIN